MEIRARLCQADPVLERLEPDSRGVLRTPLPGSWQLLRWHPSAAARPYVAWYWAVRWDLAAGHGHDQATLPHPSAHLVVDGAVALVHGPRSRRFERRLEGSGRTVGVRFRPGGIRPLLGAPVASITDRTVAAGALRGHGGAGLDGGLDGAALAHDVGRHADADAAACALDAALRPLLPADPHPSIALADHAVRLLAEDPELFRVADLADRLRLSVRSLQRLFTEYVGLGPAVVRRRYRLQEVAAEALRGEPVDWGQLAATLGYYDQAHLVRDFTATVGTPPARYAASRQGGQSGSAPPART